MKRKKRPVLDITGFLFRMRSTKAVTRVRMRKKKPVISNTDNFFCFNSHVSNLYNNSVVEKTNGMTFNPTETLKLIYWLIYLQSIVHFQTISSIMHRMRTFQTKELSFIWSGRLIFPHEYTGEGQDAEGLYLCTSAQKEAFHIL